jgi:phosphoserine aminotransferase
LPKIFRLTKGGKLNHGIFKGETINTPSMLAVEDALDALDWADGVGALPGLVARTNANLGAVEAWVEATPWIDFLAAAKATRSPTSICLKIVDREIAGLGTEAQQAFVKKLTSLLAEEGVAYDITAYRDAPPGLRLWGGATVETADLEALFPWLDWAFTEAKRPLAA